MFALKKNLLLSLKYFQRKMSHILKKKTKKKHFKKIKHRQKLK